MMTKKTRFQLPQTVSGSTESEATVLVKAIEGVFRKLIRLLIGRISLKRLQQLIQFIFIEEAEARLSKDSPNKSPTLADTVLLTGMDIRTIKKTKEQIVSGKPIYKEATFLDSFMPLFKVLDLWMNDEDFIDPDTGIPKKLKMQGNGATFSRLVNKALPYRGLSANQVLKKLEQYKAVSINPENGEATLTQQNAIFISKEFSESLNTGFNAIENLVETVSHNLECLSNQNTRLLEKGDRSPRFDPELLELNRQIIGKYLDQTNTETK